MLGDLEPADELPRIEAQGRQRGPVHAPALDGRGHRGPRLAEPAERVEQVALDPLVEEPLLVVLAVDLDERSGRLGQSRRRDRLVVDPGGRAAGRAHLADDDERLGDPVEERLDPGDVGAVADEAAVRPGAERQPERVDEQALARARSRR